MVASVFLEDGKKKKIGLWIEENPVSPWDFREKKKKEYELFSYLWEEELLIKKFNLSI